MNRIPEDDADLFREAMRDVTPLPATGRAVRDRRKPPPHARQRDADERAVLTEMMEGPILDSGEELGYRAPGVQHAVFRRLKRGTYRVLAELDLHGLRTPDARQAVSAFLSDCQRRERRCVRIIHGKGLRSKGEGPVLKQRLDGWLRRRRDVLAYCSARPEDGGTGAVYVLLQATGQ